MGPNGTDETAHTRLTATNWGALLRPRRLSRDQLSPNRAIRPERGPILPRC